MVIPVGVRGFESGDSVPELDPLYEIELDELVERTVDARNPDPSALDTDAVEDLLRRVAARLRPEVLDDRATGGTAVAKAPCLQAVERMCAPAGVVGMLHIDNDTNSH